MHESSSVNFERMDNGQTFARLINVDGNQNIDLSSSNDYSVSGALPDHPSDTSKIVIRESRPGVKPTQQRSFTIENQTDDNEQLIKAVVVRKGKQIKDVFPLTCIQTK